MQGLSHVHDQLSEVSGKMEENIKTPKLLELLQVVLEGLANVGAFANNINEKSAK